MSLTFFAGPDRAFAACLRRAGLSRWHRAWSWVARAVNGHHDTWRSLQRRRDEISDERGFGDCHVVLDRRQQSPVLCVQAVAVRGGEPRRPGQRRAGDSLQGGVEQRPQADPGPPAPAGLLRSRADIIQCLETLRRPRGRAPPPTERRPPLDTVSTQPDCLEGIEQRAHRACVLGSYSPGNGTAS